MVHTTLEVKLEPFCATLKDGTEIAIHEAQVEDAADLIRCVRNYVADNEYQVIEPGEYRPDLFQGREFIESYLESENSILIVAYDGERLVGNLEIKGGEKNRLRHTGLIAMGMLSDYRAQGLGGLLLEAAIKWAGSHPHLEKLWLQTLDGNKAALNLYEKMGFVEEGRQKDFIKVSQNTYLDNIIMYLPLNKAC
jgi:RimJ/RimL family protein N-acetyltransferase